MATERRFNCATGQTEDVEYTPAVPPVPEKVSRYAFRRALTAANAGKRTAFEAWVTTVASEEYRDYFRDSRWISRSHPAVEAARAAISVTNNAVNNIFIAALAYED